MSEATFKVMLSDGLVLTAPTTILGFVPTVSIAVKTASGMSFRATTASSKRSAAGRSFPEGSTRSPF